MSEVKEVTERRYYLAEMPEGLKGDGVPIFYKYLDVSEENFWLRQEGEEYYIGKKIQEQDDSKSGDGEIQISKKAYNLLLLAMKHKYVEEVRYALKDKHGVYDVREGLHPEGAYLGKPIIDGCVFTMDHGIEVRSIGGECIMARRLAYKPVWNEGDVSIPRYVFDFFWDCDGYQIEKVRYTYTEENDANVRYPKWYVDKYIRPHALIRARTQSPVDDIICTPPKKISEVALFNVSRDPRFRDGNIAKNGLTLEIEEVEKLMEWYSSRRN